MAKHSSFATSCSSRVCVRKWNIDQRDVRPGKKIGGKGEDILFLNNETRRLQMSRITSKHVF